jgi:hypothetical protein
MLQRQKRRRLQQRLKNRMLHGQQKRRRLQQRLKNRMLHREQRRRLQ